MISQRYFYVNIGEMMLTQRQLHVNLQYEDSDTTTDARQLTVR